MKKKLLAGILALALCSTNMPPQTIFAGEFTSGTPEVVSEEETLEIFTNEEQEAAGETDEDLSVFSSEEVPEFNDTPDEAMAAMENAQNGVIDLTNNTKVTDGVYTITSIGDHRFTCSNEQTTTNRIVVDSENTSEKDNINIYLDNVNIKTSAGPALQIAGNVKAKVTIYLTGTNNLTTTDQNSAGLEKNNTANLTIDNATNIAGKLIATGSEHGAGIGGGFGENFGGNCMNITISGGSVEAYSTNGAGIGGGFGIFRGGNCMNITISGGSVEAHSTNGAGIGGGGGFSNQYGGDCDTIIINGGSVEAHSTNGVGIGGGNGKYYGGKCSNITISGGSVEAKGVGISGGLARYFGGGCSNITISGGSVNAKVDCTPHQKLDSSGSYDPKSPEVYLLVLEYK